PTHAARRNQPVTRCSSCAWCSSAGTSNTTTTESIHDNRPRHRPLGAIKSIRNPTLVVVGLKDTATPPALSHALAITIPGAQLVELPQCGHSPHIQDPDGFWNAVKPF